MTCKWLLTMVIWDCGTPSKWPRFMAYKWGWSYPLTTRVTWPWPSKSIPNIIEHPKQITNSNNAPEWSFKNRQKMYQSGLLNCSISSMSILIATKHLQNKQLKISRNGNLATHFDRFIGLPQPFPIWRVGKPYHPVYGKLSITLPFPKKKHASWKSGTGTIIHVVGICVVPRGMEVDSMRWWHGCLEMVDHGWWRLVVVVV